MTSTPPSFWRKLSRAGALATPGAVASGLYGEAPDPFTEEEKAPASRALDFARMGTEFLSDVNPFALGAAGLLQTPKLFDPKTKMEDIDWTLADALRSARGLERKKTVDEVKINEGDVLGKDPVDLSKVLAEKRKQQMEEAFEMYRDIMDRGDDRQKWSQLGDALISGGSSLMEGEGWGAAGAKFNEPLREARMIKQQEDAAIDQMAMSQAISDTTMGDAAIQQALAAQLGAGEYDLAEATEKYKYATTMGINTRIPLDDKGEIDKDAIKDIAINGGGVFSDITNASGRGAIFLAVSSSGEIYPTNDVEEANKLAQS